MIFEFRCRAVLRCRCRWRREENLMRNEADIKKCCPYYGKRWLNSYSRTVWLQILLAFSTTTQQYVSSNWVRVGFTYGTWNGLNHDILFVCVVRKPGLLTTDVAISQKFLKSWKSCWMALMISSKKGQFSLFVGVFFYLHATSIQKLLCVYWSQRVSWIRFGHTGLDASKGMYSYSIFATGVIL